MPYSHTTYSPRQFFPSDFTQITSQEIQAWIDKLTCISDRLAREIGFRTHRHGTFKNEMNGDTALDWLIKTCTQTFDTSQVFIWLADRETGEISIDTHMSAYPPDPQLQWKLPERIEQVARDKQSLILAPSTSPSLGVGMVVPISLGDWFIGALLVGPSRSSAEYSIKDLETLEFIVEVTTVCCHLAAQSKSETRTFSEIVTSFDGAPEEHRNAA